VVKKLERLEMAWLRILHRLSSNGLLRHLGFGCPGSDLTKEMRAQREHLFMHDWCPWKTSCRSVGLDSSPTGKELKERDKKGIGNESKRGTQ